MSTATVDPLKVIDGMTFEGSVNTDDAALLANIRSSIRRGHPQVWRTNLKPERIALVGSGPSLKDTEGELVALLQAGAKLVTVNGAYQWCVQRNLIPSAQVVLDARPSSARFVDPALPLCRYYLASQCDPAVWDAVEGRPFVGIWHAVAGEGPLAEELNQYFAGQWHAVAAGTTVTTRALMLMRAMGYLRFDLFGFDSCWFGHEHHAIAQPENEKDQRIAVKVSPTGAPEQARVFQCAPWMLKQAEDWLQLVRVAGDQFLANVHGDGLIAFMMRASAHVSLDVVDAAGAPQEGV